MKPDPYAERRIRLAPHLTKEQLRSLFHREKDVRLRERLHALWLGHDDPDWKEVARIIDRRYDTVFVYHNGADSYYAARGFRGSLRV